MSSTIAITGHATATVPEIEEADQILDATQDDFIALAHCNDGTGGLVDLFFSDSIPDIRRAKAICHGCPLRIACLSGAQKRREPWGVWGGELFTNGKIVTVKRPRGRPPKRKVQLTA